MGIAERTSVSVGGHSFDVERFNDQIRLVIDIGRGSEHKGMSLDVEEMERLIECLQSVLDETSKSPEEYSFYRLSLKGKIVGVGFASSLELRQEDHQRELPGCYIEEIATSLSREEAERRLELYKREDPFPDKSQFLSRYT